MKLLTTLKVAFYYVGVIIQVLADDIVGWVIWPVKIVPEMPYKGSTGTLSLYSLSLS